MYLGVLGINHKLASIELREAISRACHKYFGTEKIIHAQGTFVLLSTCNRTEVYFSSTDLGATHSYLLNLLREEIDQNFEQRLYTFFGVDCFLHLCRVTVGLDSAILAETEIQGQVKTSYEKNAALIQLSSELHFIFQKALHIAKQIRRRILNRPINASLEQIVWKLCQKHLDSSEKVLVIGASQTNIRLLNYLQKYINVKNIFLCNRTLKKAQEIGEKIGCTILPWEALEGWNTFEAVICGTKADYLLIEPGSFDSSYSTKLFIDLSLPRNISPAVQAYGYFYDIDYVQALVRQHQDHLQLAIQQAEDQIEQAVLRYAQSWQLKKQQKKPHLIFA